MSDKYKILKSNLSSENVICSIFSYLTRKKTNISLCLYRNFFFSFFLFLLENYTFLKRKKGWLFFKSNSATSTFSLPPLTSPLPKHKNDCQLKKIKDNFILDSRDTEQHYLCNPAHLSSAIHTIKKKKVHPNVGLPQSRQISCFS